MYKLTIENYQPKHTIFLIIFIKLYDKIYFNNGHIQLIKYCRPWSDFEGVDVKNLYTQI